MVLVVLVLTGCAVQTKAAPVVDTVFSGKVVTVTRYQDVSGVSTRLLFAGGRSVLVQGDYRHLVGASYQVTVRPGDSLAGEVVSITRMD